MSEIVGAIDLGSTKITVIIGNIDEKEVEIAGFSLVQARGVRYGLITDINEASSSIAEAINKAVKMAGIKNLQRTFVAIGGEKITAIPSRGMIIVKSRDQEVTEKDVERAIEAAKATAIPSDREIIYHMVRGFKLDGQDGISNPINMVGTRLESDLLLITHDKVQLRNIMNTLEKAEINVDGFIPQEVASAEAVLTPEEKKLGVVMVDIGGDLTNLAVFEEGYIHSIGILKLGGEKITKDLAITLRISTEEAERAKKILGTLKNDKEETLEVMSLQEKKIKITTSQVREIIQPRVEEILEFIARKLEELNSPLELIPGGIVLTGGTALLDGIVDFTSDYLNIPVRLSYPSEMANFLGMNENEAVFYSCAVGALKRVTKDTNSEEKSRKFLDYLKETFNNILKPFKE
ncbi:MAG TPA: cell division protein FtsA [Dictyoglomaceae bacterium]|nr:cell division protein FtsA [Dictyoglomaceae bacterium]HOL38857.1 cell division protein FtsA [Dictyoglomaceae bacterium]HOP95384.1 cell division protein FtsA [Dictyoglomaceae bacterium]HPP15726.1 cell division protein FtsA [Dictyoglomaceae bacterium]HPU43710.1 cell division protein FtsA [Dictyoglomaceae bacterium]